MMPHLKFERERKTDKESPKRVLPQSRWRHPLRYGLLLGVLAAAPAWADRTIEQIEMAATGRFDRLEQTLEAQEAAGPLDGKDRHALCYAYSRTKRYDRLMRCLDTLENTFRSGSKRTRLFGLEDGTPTVYIMRAEALLELGQYVQAATEAERALKWLREDDSSDMDLFASSLAALSMSRTLSGERGQGEQFARELAALDTGSGNAYTSAKAMALARARMALRDFPGVIAALKSDRTFELNVFLDRLFSGSFLTGVNNWVWVELPRAFMMNKALLETGQVNEAKAGFDRLLAIPQVKANGEIYWLLCHDRGRLAEQSGERAVALKYYLEAIEAIEVQRASIHTEATKIGFVGDKQAVYADAVRVALALNQKEQAYELVERSKSRALVDLLAARDGSVRLSGRDGNSQQLLERYQTASDAALLQLPLDMSQAGNVGSRSGVTSTAQALKSRAPELASLVTVAATPLPEIRRGLAADEALVEYFGFGKDLFILVMAGEQIQTERIDATTLESEVRQFRSRIAERQPEALDNARTLYRLLLAPFENLIGKRNLVLVPHGPLHYLPFVALHDGKDFLLARRNVRYLPSASVQQYIPARRSRTLENMLLFGNPDLGNPNYDLPSAEEEARMIAGLVSGSKLLLRREATETLFRNEARQYSFLHVASHGQFKADNALQSRLLLARDAQNDGSLTVGELYNLHLDADLVTLSACETGLGKALSGDDLIGLTRGFLYAGGRNIIASLWEVDDEATAEMMKRFYGKLKTGMSKKEALRQAQQEVREKYPEPMFWAAFYLTGQGL